MTRNNNFQILADKVIKTGLCTHCGTCAGLSEGDIEMKEEERGPLPERRFSKSKDLPGYILEACPGLRIDYPRLNEYVFNKLPLNWIIGNVFHSYIGYSSDDHIRLKGASGGVITQCLLFLMENKYIDGAIVVKQGSPEPWLAEPVIATSPEEIIECSQSVYAPVPVNTILGQLKRFPGKVAYVGLPDQVASIRYLQSTGNEITKKITYILGPYVGINMYPGAVKNFLKANGFKDFTDIASLKYREGEWPGYLQIVTTSGKILKAEKFYYNYLLPFYITKSTKYSVDFTNELTDISVGDAWHPKYEGIGKGFAVVLGRTEKGMQLLQKMNDRKVLTLEEKTLDEVMDMHGHMLDFKKRGSFIRMLWRKKTGKPIPDYGYWPEHIPLSRKMVELVISGIFVLCSTTFARWMIRLFPIGFIGRIFNFLRKAWKNISKPTKRKGLSDQRFIITNKS